MTDEFDPIKDALRDSLHRHAADAPRGDLLAERIINTAQRAPELDRQRTRRGWRTWTLPLIAAGAVAAVVGAVVGIENFRPEASRNAPGHTGVPSVLSDPAPTQLQSTQPTNPPTTSASIAPPDSLTGFKITDLTFAYGEGWALGSADCLSGPGRCTALWHTSDGQHWTSMGGERFNVVGVKDCTDPCVNQIRFANPQTGYAFGPSALFMTTDGGRSWRRQDGGAIQLETLDNNVIRVTGTDSGCPGPCVHGIETSAVGSSNWTRATFQPDLSGMITRVLLARGNGGYAYLLTSRSPAGGAENERSTLYRSTDNGAIWTNVGEPCPQGAQEVDSGEVAASPDGRVSVLCTVRGKDRTFLAVSTDAGDHFVSRPGTISSAMAFLLAGDPNTVLIAAQDGMARSTDGGVTWQKVGDVTGQISWVGFESQTVGRAVSADGTTIWTTRDGGATWHRASIG
jgi:photosystem II stability/assembly factor-like uncharacterized protein